jgi:hypothetical protein
LLLRSTLRLVHALLEEILLIVMTGRKGLSRRRKQGE